METRRTFTLIVLMLAACIPVAASRVLYGDSLAYSKGQRLFMRNCGHCHALKNMDIVGPPLHKIREKRSEKWITAFLLDRSFRQHDAAALEIKRQYSNIEHPDFVNELTKQDIKALLYFIRLKAKKDKK